MDEKQGVTTAHGVKRIQTGRVLFIEGMVLVEDYPLIKMLMHIQESLNKMLTIVQQIRRRKTIG